MLIALLFHFIVEQKDIDMEAAMQRLAHLNQNEKKPNAPAADSFEIESDQERRKVFLRYVNRAWLILGIVTLLLLPFFPEQRAQFIFLIEATFPSYLIIRLLELSGRTRLAGVLFTFSVNFGFYGLFMVLVGELGAYKAFETEASVWMLMGLAVLFAGALVDKLAAPGLALINTILLIGTRLTIAPDSDPRPSALVFWWLMALTTWLYERTLGQALGRVLAELAERKQAEVALRESRLKYRNLVEHLPQVIYTSELGMNGVWAYVSPQIENLLGFTPEEWTADQSNWKHQVHPDDLADQNALEERAFANGERFEGEYRMFTRDGHEIWVRDAGHIFMGEEGKPPIVQGLLTDITERKQAAEKMFASEVRYRRLFEAAKDGILILDADTGEIVDVNPFLKEMLGYSHTEFLGKQLWELGLFKDIVSNKASFQELKKNRYIRYENLPLKTNDGHSIWVEFVSNVYDVDGKQVIQCNIRDITERKRAEEKLNESEAYYRMLTESLSDFVVHMDREGKILYINHLAVGYTMEQVQGSSAYEYIPPEYHETMRRALNKVFQEGQPATFETQGQTSATTIGWYLTRLVPVRKNEEVTGALLISTDIAERKQAEGQIQRQIQHLRALHTIDSAISSSFDLQMTLRVLLREVISQLGVDAADVLLFNQPTQVLEYAAAHGFHSNAIQHTQLHLGEGFAGRAVAEGRIIHIPNMMEAGGNLANSLLLAGESFVTYFGVPLIAKGQVVGVLEVFHRTPLEPDQEWLDFLDALAKQAAIAIDNARLFDNLQRSNTDLIVAYDATLEGWSRAMDLRDRETEGHTQRVTEMAMHLAQLMGIEELDLIHFRRGGMLHDIGKLGVPDSILLKPDNLTDAEWELMRLHPKLAYEMLLPITYLKPAFDIPYCHHEKWDGTGYPRGLKGEQIPLAARIFSVVDVWDAVTSNRPYRLAWPKEQALDYIKEQSGKHFDPQVVEAFLGLIIDQ